MIVLNGDPSSMLLNDAFEIALEYEIPVSAPHRLFTKACSNMIRLQADERTWKQKPFGSKEVSIQMHIMQIHMQISVYRDKLDGYCINWKLLKYSSDSNSMISVFSNIHWVMTVNTFDSNFINWTQRIWGSKTWYPPLCSSLAHTSYITCTLNHIFCLIILPAEKELKHTVYSYIYACVYVLVSWTENVTDSTCPLHTVPLDSLYSILPI